MRKRLRLEKRYLLEVMAEFGSAFKIPSFVWKARSWVRSVVSDPDQIVVLPAGGGGNLIWTREEDEWRIVLQTPQSRSEIGGKLDEWIKMPHTSRIKRRGVSIKLSPHTLIRDVVWGADRGMKLPEEAR